MAYCHWRYGQGHMLIELRDFNGRTHILGLLVAILYLDDLLVESDGDMHLMLYKINRQSLPRLDAPLTAAEARHGVARATILACMCDVFDPPVGRGQGQHAAGSGSSSSGQRGRSSGTQRLPLCNGPNRSARIPSTSEVGPRRGNSSSSDTFEVDEMDEKLEADETGGFSSEHSSSSSTDLSSSSSDGDGPDSNTTSDLTSVSNSSTSSSSDESSSTTSSSSSWSSYCSSSSSGSSSS